MSWPDSFLEAVVAICVVAIFLKTLDDLKDSQ